MNITLDRTTIMLLDLLVKRLAEEPPQDAGGHPSTDVHDRIGAEWAAWDREVAALRLLVGIRLTKEGVHQYQQHPQMEAQ